MSRHKWKVRVSDGQYCEVCGLTRVKVSSAQRRAGGGKVLHWEYWRSRTNPRGDVYRQLEPTAGPCASQGGAK